MSRATVTFEFDFGEPSGGLEDFGCEHLSCASDVLAELRGSGSSVMRACENWGLLTAGSVVITVYDEEGRRTDVTWSDWSE